MALSFDKLRALRASRGLEIPPAFNIAHHFVDRPAEAHPQRPAILGLPAAPGVPSYAKSAGKPAAVSYREIEEWVNRAGNALRGLGCQPAAAGQPGDRVLIVLPDSVEFIAAFFGAAKIGAVAVPVNPMARAADHAYSLSDSGARIAIVHQGALGEFLPALEGRALGTLVVVGGSQARQSPTLAGDGGERPRPEGSGRAHTLDWHDWLEAASSRLEPHPTSSTDTAFFLYTSGSGGTPKAAVHQHKDMLVTSQSFARGVLGLRPDDLTFSVSKLFFAYGLGNGMYFPFSVGASALLNAERPRPEKVMELVARHRPTVFFSVPTFYAALLQERDRGTRADFSSVRLAVSSGEALPAELFEQFRRRFGLAILDGIGSTEMLHMFISNRPEQARAGTCGIEVPNYEAAVVDDAGQPVPSGEIGNLWVRGQSAFAGYWNKPELTACAFRDGWVVTGDKFFRDDEGYYHYCGRADDMMKVSGMWVSPGEVENALLGHPQVAEAAVVGATDAWGLVRPVAYVVLREGAEASPQVAQEIREFVQARLVSYQCPQEVRFLGELPKTATGKIQRYRLRGRP
jgi:benzoate-CoA ligase